MGSGYPESRRSSNLQECPFDSDTRWSKTLIKICEVRGHTFYFTPKGQFDSGSFIEVW